MGGSHLTVGHGDGGAKGREVVEDGLIGEEIGEGDSGALPRGGDAGDQRLGQLPAAEVGEELVEVVQADPPLALGVPLYENSRWVGGWVDR